MMIKLLLREFGKETPHFSQVLSQIDKQEDLSLPAPAAIRYSEGVYTLLYNPEKLFQYQLQEQVVIISHEMLHVLNYHHCRWQDKNPALWNIAADCAVNSYLLDKFSDRLQEELILPTLWSLPLNKTAEWYYSKLLREDIGDLTANHPHWYRLNTEEAETSLTQIRHAADSALGWSLTLADKKPNWKSVLANKIKYHCSSKKGYSGKRFSRRYNKPPGKRRTRQPLPILVAIDTSPSISSETLNEFFTHVRDIAKQIKSKIHVIECDDIVRKVYEFSGEFKPVTRQSEKTLVTPALEKAGSLHRRGKVGALLYFTDGDIHETGVMKPTGFPVVWVYPSKGHKKIASWGDHVCLS